MSRAAGVPAATLFLAGMFLCTRAPAIAPHLGRFYLGFGLASLGYLGLLRFGLPGGRRSWPAFFVLLVLVPRLFALHLTPSDDVARYVWEGRILREGFNPFAITPEDPRLAAYRDAVYPLINHKDMPAIYPPVAQAVFVLLSTVTRSVEGYRLFLAGVELLAVGLMFPWLRALGLPRERVALYALNPLVILGIAGHGHLDSLQILLLVAGLWLWARRREGGAMVLVTLAGLVKFLAFFALPFLVRRRTLKYLPLCGGIVLASYLPFCILEGAFSFGNLGHYLGVFEYYSLTFAPLRFLFGTAGAHAVTAAVLAGALAALWLTRTRPEPAMAPFLLLVTLMNTTVHYWYLLPVLALCVVWRSRAAVALSLLFVPYFDVLQRLYMEGVFVGAWWRPVATYLPFLALLWLEMTGRWPAFRAGTDTVGVVVPVLDDAGALGRLLGTLRGAGVRPEDVVVADGGSQDDGPVVAERWGARVVTCGVRGRGNQIARGVEALETDLVVVLHADCRAPPDLIPAVRRAAAAYPEAAGGACRLRYEAGGRGMELVAILTNAKTILFGLSFGDQAQWFRRSCIRVPAIPLMEDVELSLRMNDKGGTVRTPATVEVSSRRYERQGAGKVVGAVVRQVLGYLFRRVWSGEPPDTAGLYRDYYG